MSKLGPCEICGATAHVHDYLLGVPLCPAWNCWRTAWRRESSKDRPQRMPEPVQVEDMLPKTRKGRPIEDVPLPDDPLPEIDEGPSW